MGHESISSPHRRSQNPVSPLSSSFRKQFQARDDAGGWATLLNRHKFLLTMLAILTFLCTIYLYFAVTLGAKDSCHGLPANQKALCYASQIKSNIHRKGKLRLF
eukprot:TRINITY_DN8112_c0_g1_i1.p1 TRINITY_DN8112_c0_g1~~TRINITY_DN8112_c0_g1_i1.p1  ORF type:complete len:104 (-),score=13.18 TRINITY_DN8112_c0_g1_i1:272-583(-)